jgi:hypothetical protein
MVKEPGDELGMPRRKERLTIKSPGKSLKRIVSSPGNGTTHKNSKYTSNNYQRL